MRVSSAYSSTHILCLHSVDFQIKPYQNPAWIFNEDFAQFNMAIPLAQIDRGGYQIFLVLGRAGKSSKKFGSDLSAKNLIFRPATFTRKPTTGGGLFFIAFYSICIHIKTRSRDIPLLASGSDSSLHLIHAILFKYLFHSLLCPLGHFRNHLIPLISVRVPLSRLDPLLIILWQPISCHFH